MRHQKGIRILVLAAVLLSFSLFAADSCRVRLEKFLPAEGELKDRVAFQHGTGERFNDDGVIVTAAHVVEDAAENGYSLFVECEEGWVRAKIVALDKSVDVAFVKPVLPVTLKHTDIKDGSISSIHGKPLALLQLKKIVDERRVHLIGGSQGMSGSVLYSKGKPLGLIVSFQSADGVTPFVNPDGSNIVNIVPWLLVEFVWSKRVAQLSGSDKKKFREGEPGDR